MTQLNIHMTPAFEHDLQRFMKLRHIQTKAEAVRTAIRESLEHSAANTRMVNFSTWIGLAQPAPVNKKPKFHSNNDLWKRGIVA